MAARRHGVVVVGGGVVGAATALALVRQGLDVALVERGAAPGPLDPAQHDLRVYALAPASVDLLERLGAWERVAARRVSPYVRMRVWEGSLAQELKFDAAELAVPQLGFIVEDSLLRASLWSALAGSVRVLTGTAVTGFDPNQGRPRLTLGSGEVLEAELVVAAEGGDSPLREAAGIDPVGWSYPQRSIVCNVATARPHEATAWQRFLPGGPLAFLPLADGRSSIVWSTAEAEAAELLALDDASFRARLEEACGALGAITDSTARLAFPLRLLHAEAYVRPGLALVGDSAHVVHPLAGQGLNLGLADVAALAEAVAGARAARKPAGNLRWLARYERRRRAANIEMLALTDGLHRLFGIRGGAAGSMRELGLSLMGRAAPLRDFFARRAMGLAPRS